MENLEQAKQILIQYKNELRKKYKVKTMGIFGSYARGEETAHSDLDLLVEFEGPIGLLFVDLADDLEKLLGIKVDLVSKGAFKRKPLLWNSIQKDLVYV